VQWVARTGDEAHAFVEVRGFRGAPAAAVVWAEALPVYAEARAAATAPPPLAMLGEYRVDAITVRFTPQFPLSRGVVYRAVLDTARFTAGAAPRTATFELPAAPPGQTVIKTIYPSADTLPENLLKFYLHFSAPMSGGRVYQHIHLRDGAGREVELPFVELDEGLWNPTMTRLTLLLDPGRIKRGVRPPIEVGAALSVSERYTLTVDRTWLDAAGQPLREHFEKKFQVSEADRTPPDPQRWTITAPAAQTRAALSVNFGEPLDHALASRMIRVETSGGATVEGDVRLASQETRWNFVPDRAWPAGDYGLVIATTIEDFAGNNIGKPFDVDLSAPGSRAVPGESVSVPFKVR
jgi:hypothetical protein